MVIHVRPIGKGMVMKKLLLLLLLIGCMVQTAIAENILYAVCDLPSVTSSHWNAQYEAYGRTIQVNVPITIPAVDTAPVIAVRRMPALSEPVRSELAAWYAQAEKDDPINRYAFSSNDYSTRITHALPPAWGKDRSSQFIAGSMEQNLFDLYDFDMDKAYADNNTLTVAEAIAILTQQAASVFPDETLFFRTAYVDGQTFWKQTGEPIREQGGYSLCLSQTFHCIPLMASIHEAFTQFALGNEDIWLANRGILRSQVFSSDAWSVICTFYQESCILHEDIPLLPFDAVKSKIEMLILSGHIRWIDSVTLGYVQFDSAAPDEQVLIPCWVTWCEYHANGAVSERRSGINQNADLLYDGNSDVYQPIIINAQTGELIDPESTAEGRCLFPKIEFWEDVQ